MTFVINLTFIIKYKSLLLYQRWCFQTLVRSIEISLASRILFRRKIINLLHIALPSKLFAIKSKSVTKCLWIDWKMLSIRRIIWTHNLARRLIELISATGSNHTLHFKIHTSHLWDQKILIYKQTIINQDFHARGDHQTSNTDTLRTTQSQFSSISKPKMNNPKRSHFKSNFMNKTCVKTDRQIKFKAKLVPR